MPRLRRLLICSAILLSLGPWSPSLAAQFEYLHVRHRPGERVVFRSVQHAFENAPLSLLTYIENGVIVASFGFRVSPVVSGHNEEVMVRTSQRRRTRGDSVVTTYRIRPRVRLTRYNNRDLLRDPTPEQLNQYRFQIYSAIRGFLDRECQTFDQEENGVFLCNY
ncbi:MAG: hypothetical protein H7X93_09350 [Sphingomonadaceae bacterium]|nr:hypothetical protein [Sphingomonadaceae bacterium]